MNVRLLMFMALGVAALLGVGIFLHNRGVF
jgi:hypothetical protein